MTFRGARRHLGFETTRPWKEKSVPRAGPCPPGLFGGVSLIYARRLSDRRREAAVLSTAWYDKREPTISDALACVRRPFWQQTIFKQAAPDDAFQKLPPSFRETLLQCLSRVA